MYFLVVAHLLPFQSRSCNRGFTSSWRSFLIPGSCELTSLDSFDFRLSAFPQHHSASTQGEFLSHVLSLFDMSVLHLRGILLVASGSSWVFVISVHRENFRIFLFSSPLLSVLKLPRFIFHISLRVDRINYTMDLPLSFWLIPVVPLFISVIPFILLVSWSRYTLFFSFPDLFLPWWPNNLFHQYSCLNQVYIGSLLKNPSHSHHLPVILSCILDLFVLLMYKSSFGTWTALILGVSPGSSIIVSTRRMFFLIPLYRPWLI